MLNRNELLELDDDNLLRQCRQESYRASGPGGQHRNTTDSAVRLTVLGGSVVALCADHRSQHRNRAEALRRLRSAIAIGLRVPLASSLDTTDLDTTDLDTTIWKGPWKLGLKDRRYAGFIAHLLDVMAHHDWAVGRAAEALGTSTGKLIRILAHDPHAWNAVNHARAKLGLVNLRRP